MDGQHPALLAAAVLNALRERIDGPVPLAHAEALDALYEQARLLAVEAVRVFHRQSDEQGPVCSPDVGEPGMAAELDAGHRAMPAAAAAPPPDAGEQSALAEIADRCAAAARALTAPADAVPPTDSAVTDSDCSHSQPDCSDSEPDLRPGQIPAQTLPPAAPAPIELLVDIASNARAGEPYRAAVSVRTRDGEHAEIVECLVPAESGVRYENGELNGDDPAAGEYALRLTCALAGPPPAAGLAAESTLIVNPNPKDLWKNIPSDRDAAGWKPDAESRAKHGAWGRTLLAASVRGRSHAHRGAFRDDHFALQVTAEDGWNVLAVADGAGSAPRSRIGSRIAADTAVAVAAERLCGADGEALLDQGSDASPNPTSLSTAAYRVLAPAAFEAVKAIEGKAREHGFEPRDYATTLLLVLHRRLGEHELVASYWVGDGAIAALTGPGEAVLLGHPHGGDFAGQTRFLDRDAVRDGDEIARCIRVQRLPALDALLLMTDGVSDPKFESERALENGERWAGLLQEIAAALAGTDDAARLCDWLGFHAPGHHDDRTLIVLR